MGQLGMEVNATNYICRGQYKTELCLSGSIEFRFLSLVPHRELVGLADDHDHCRVTGCLVSGLFRLSSESDCNSQCRCVSVQRSAVINRDGQLKTRQDALADCNGKKGEDMQ